jgi:hypothetical protein
MLELKTAFPPFHSKSIKKRGKAQLSWRALLQFLEESLQFLKE